MNIRTHQKISKELVGKPLDVVDGVKATVELKTTDDMAADSTGLVHGGFTFGLADYAAMLAVNHPYVVLESAQTRFTAPVRVGEVMTAEATVTKNDGRKSDVSVDVKVTDRKVFAGQFTCYILERHVLSQ